ncbi:AlpA family phage regulatory protein [Serratia fonticola]|nr:AlpA family phage regulatory protein [Serratia fonticola]NYA41225.1 AlpA family phage regulatory protein [Serratia fonticola]
MSCKHTIKIVTMSEVMEMLNYKTRNSIYYLEANANFPPRIKIGIRRVGYDLDAIKQWLESRTM